MSRLTVIGLLAVIPLIGCVDLNVQTYHDVYYTYTGPYVLVQCEDNWGGQFSGGAYRTLENGHYPMSPLLLGMNPLATALSCRVYDAVYECCDEIHFSPWDTEVPVTLGCGKYHSMNCPGP